MATSELWTLSAVELSEQIAKGEVSAREAVGANIDRMQARNGAMNAVVDDLSESAMADAARLDEAFARSGPVGPLHGVPITIKKTSIRPGMPPLTVSPPSRI